MSNPSSMRFKFPIIVLLAVAVAAFTQPMSFAAGKGGKWRSASEAIADGTLKPPAPIVQVDFQYDAGVTPVLKVKNATVKYGYAPLYPPKDSGYTVVIKSARGDVLRDVVFEIPNVIEGLPAQSPNDPPEQPKVLRKMEFSMTLNLPEGAAVVMVTDPQQQTIFQEDIKQIPVKKGTPQFRTFSPGDSHAQMHGTAGGTLLALIQNLLVGTAEAATTDNVALDIAFVGDDYAAADLPRFEADVNAVINYMMTYQPYAARASQIRFHIVDNTADLGCYYDAQTTRLIVCNNSAVTSVVNNAGAPYDKIIVLLNNATYGGSGGSGVAVSYNGSSMTQVVVHEFGHSLTLKDEYNLYASNGSTSGGVSANCYGGVLDLASPSCSPPSAWSALGVTCSNMAVGCNYPNWYRPSPCSIMLQLSCPYYNSVSQKLINSQLDYYAGPQTTGPKVTLAPTPAVIGPGRVSTLNWASQDVTSCTASGAWTGAKSTMGTESVSASATSTYMLTCTGPDGAASAGTTVTVDTQAPIVSIASPVNGAALTGGLVAVSATASDNVSVSKVEFYRDSVLMAVATSAPFQWSWGLTQEAAGTHALYAKAYDSAGNVGTSGSISVSVVRDTQVPFVNITSPVNGATVSGKVAVAVAATDNAGVQKVEIFIDGVLRVADSSSPYTYTWSTSGMGTGTHTIMAKAYDTSGNTNTASIAVNVKAKGR